MPSILATSLSANALQSWLMANALDITAPEHVEIKTDQTGKILWVNIMGVCVLRCCAIQHLAVDVRDGKRATATDNDNDSDDTRA